MNWDAMCVMGANDFCDGQCNACLEVLARWGPSALDPADFNVDGAARVRTSSTVCPVFD